MPFVRTIPYSEADGELKAMYDQLLQTRGNISNVIAVNSLRPHIMKTLSAHNNSVMRSESGLSPAERQMIATVVSAINRCQY
jgi:alkylhydroperoxidase family enzyme